MKDSKVRDLFLFTLLCLVLNGCYDATISHVNLRIGDSLMEQNTRFTFQKELLQDFGPMTINNAVSGSALEHNEYWIPRIEYINAKIVPSNLFISLGTNDALIGNFKGAAAIATSVDDLMSAVNPLTQVYWIPPHQMIQGERNTVYAEIVRASLRWQNMTILDFDEWIDSNGLDRSTLLKPDQIHLTYLGNQAFTEMILSVQTIECPDCANN